MRGSEQDVRAELAEGSFRRADFRMEARRRTAERGAEKGPAVYDVAISSEVAIPRWFGLDILGHGKDEVDLTRFDRGAALLVDHGGDMIGTVMPGSARVVVSASVGGEEKTSEQRVSHIRFRVGIMKYFS